MNGFYGDIVRFLLTSIFQLQEEEEEEYEQELEDEDLKGAEKYFSGLNLMSIYLLLNHKGFEGAFSKFRRNSFRLMFYMHCIHW